MEDRMARQALQEKLSTSSKKTKKNKYPNTIRDPNPFPQA